MRRRGTYFISKLCLLSGLLCAGSFWCLRPTEQMLCPSLSQRPAGCLSGRCMQSDTVVILGAVDIAMHKPRIDSGRVNYLACHMPALGREAVDFFEPGAYEEGTVLSDIRDCIRTNGMKPARHDEQPKRLVLEAATRGPIKIGRSTGHRLHPDNHS